MLHKLLEKSTCVVFCQSKYNFTLKCDNSVDQSNCQCKLYINPISLKVGSLRLTQVGILLGVYEPTADRVKFYRKAFCDRGPRIYLIEIVSC